MLYHEREFVQILEGEEEVVMALYDRIERDKRHRHVTIIHKETVATRAFDSWSMAFKTLSDVDVDQMKDQLNLKEFTTLMVSADKTTISRKMFNYFGQIIFKKLNL